MPLDGSGVYVLPSNTKAVTGTTVASAPYNAFLDDLVQVLNTVQTVARGGTGQSSVPAILQEWGIEPGTDIQAYSALLKALADLSTVAADKIIYSSGENQFTAADLSAYMRGLLATASVGDLRTALSVSPTDDVMLKSNIGTDADEFIQLNSNGNIPSGITLEDGVGAGAVKFILIDEKAAGTDGGTATTGSWAVRVLNTIKYRETTGTLTLHGTSSFTIAERMRIKWTTQGYACGRFKSRLVRHLDDVVMATSENGLANGSSAHMQKVAGEMVVDAGRYRIEQRSTSARSGDGMGLAADIAGTPEVYTQVVGMAY